MRARVSHEGVTQVFIGVYDSHGILMGEEFHDRGRDVPYCAALEWGAQRARDMVAGASGLGLPQSLDGCDQVIVGNRFSNVLVKTRLAGLFNVAAGAIAGQGNGRHILGKRQLT
ncbi:hypothetical protein PMI36_02794 [Pseudomonas sp. GM79]|nr:hypothetical protein PMI36_02794 [Pseudomonas sp. GM79]